jgi:hypothetical protein
VQEICVMEHHDEDPATPASGTTMSTTFLATFFVIALLVGGVSLFWHLTGSIVPEMFASVDPTAQALPTP